MSHEVQLSPAASSSPLPPVVPPAGLFTVGPRQPSVGLGGGWRLISPPRPAQPPAAGAPLGFSLWPFAYIGGRFLLATAQYDASAISQMSFQAAATTMSAGTSTVSRYAEAAAGVPGRGLLRPDPRPAGTGLLPGTILSHRDNGTTRQVSIAACRHPG